MKILIVEDEPIIRKMIVDDLTAKGHTVFEAGDGREGARLCLSERPDWTVTDMNMPFMDGDRMIEAVRKTWPEARFLAMSASTRWNLPPDVRLLVKPFDLRSIDSELR